jgi:hypothetical protein
MFREGRCPGCGEIANVVAAEIKSAGMKKYRSCGKPFCKFYLKTGLAESRVEIMDCKWTKQTWFEASGHGQEEHYLVAAIKRNLLSPEDKKWLNEKDYSVEDLLNGRTERADEERVQKSSVIGTAS